MQVTRRVFDTSQPEHKMVANIYRPATPPPAATNPAATAITLLLVHGTGFHKEMWEPVIDRLQHGTARWTVSAAVAIDMCSHGDSALLNRAQLQNEHQASWFTHARDILHIIGQLRKEGMTCMVGIGHSWGAGVLLLAETLSPLTFTCLLPTEAVLFLRPMQDEKYCSMIQRRKHLWRSQAEAQRYFSSHKLFRTWDPRCIDLHVQHGLERTTQGHWMLKCRPESEAAVYRGAHYASWYTTMRLWQVRCPTGFVVGRRSLQSPEEYVRRVSADMADRRVAVVEDAGHLVVLEKPDVAAALYAEFLDDMVPRSRDARRQIDFLCAKL